MKDFEKIINKEHSSCIVNHKGINLFVIENRNTGKLTPIPCVCKVFTNNSNSKALKIANNNSKCFMTSKALGIESQFNDCYSCYRQCLEQFNNKNIFLVKK